MKKKELDAWYRLLRQVKNGNHLSSEDNRELVHLNFRVMEEAHKIHNDEMLKDL